MRFALPRDVLIAATLAAIWADVNGEAIGVFDEFVVLLGICCVFADEKPHVVVFAAAFKGTVCMSVCVVATEMISNSRCMKYAVLWVHGNRFGETNESSDDFAVMGFKEFGVWLHSKQDPVAMIFTEARATPAVAVSNVNPDCRLFTPAGAHKMWDKIHVIAS